MGTAVKVPKHGTYRERGRELEGYGHTWMHSYTKFSTVYGQYLPFLANFMA